MSIVSSPFTSSLSVTKMPKKVTQIPHFQKTTTKEKTKKKPQNSREQNTAATQIKNWQIFMRLSKFQIWTAKRPALVLLRSTLLRFVHVHSCLRSDKLEVLGKSLVYLLCFVFFAFFFCFCVFVFYEEDVWTRTIFWMTCGFFLNCYSSPILSSICPAGRRTVRFLKLEPFFFLGNNECGNCCFVGKKTKQNKCKKKKKRKKKKRNKAWKWTTLTTNNKAKTNNEKEKKNTTLSTIPKNKQNKQTKPKRTK